MNIVLLVIAGGMGLGALLLGGLHRAHRSPLGTLVVVVIGATVLGHMCGMGDGKVWSGSWATQTPGVARVMTTASGPGVVYTFDQMTQGLETTGMQHGNARIGAAVAEAESSGRSAALCDSCAGVREYSVGPWQINLDAHPDVTAACAQDLACVVPVVDRISAHGMDWSPWSTYNSDAYLSHLQ